MCRTAAVVVLASIASTHSDPAISASRWFCAAELSTGFKLNGKVWQSVDFTTDKSRYTISRDDQSQWVVQALGSRYPTHRCENTGTDAKVWLTCGGLGYGFVFREDSLRFQEFYGFGYLDGRDEPGNTPAITIGVCSEID